MKKNRCAQGIVKPSGLLLAAATVLAAAWSASASIVEVFPGDPAWGNPPSENGNGTGYSLISGAAPYAGNGSLELHGDRTRWFGLGNPYSAASNLGLLSSVTDFRFDWMRASAGTGPGAAASYSPALRIHVWDGAQRSELIWENAYNGNATATLGTWYSTGGINDNFYRFQSGIGSAGETAGLGLLDWFTSAGSYGGNYSANAYVSAVSIGIGSSAGAGYTGFADNLTLAFGANSTTYNFNVPEPGQVAASVITLLGVGGFMVSKRMRRKTAARA